jgi:hypothetical protein
MLDEVEDMPVYRLRPLPVAPLRGNFWIHEALLPATQRALQAFAIDGIRDGGHEGMLFWTGRSVGEHTFLIQAILPNAQHSRLRVHASKEAVADAARAARNSGLGILCQVHSHPGSDTRHSDGDDDLVLLPFDGMLSIVAPNFGIGLKSLAQCSVHQFQRDRWVLCDPASVGARVKLIPSEIDLRESMRRVLPPVLPADK